ncbi:prepilin-type N-terminal cleavage/methylation domain-containing protein [Kineosporia rhizophila]|uniref:PulJ/GspJ family protein n=1 Tax=Kineosporia TaxID=49184 RepID=UPI001E648F9F|nr:prepilin-type N-terminal cleavage/methylation domain-containing protein [Kineosporia sp. NBRC 101677]MCE0535383.1 prepilin-type N-terminal cleavage/methylation domain-containing protein [Kineosporia rhizophila]GLY16837.1 hypothetical protein Kisp01_38520 [Kineosporia sp. NBRC 101677]
MRARGEDGLTLIEMIVAMTIFGAVLGMFVTVVANFTAMTTKTVNLADQSADARVVYNLFDRSVRSASAVNRPQRTGNNWYVEWLSTVTDPELCTQWVLRTDTDTLALRTWVPVSSGTTTPSNWRTVSTDVVNTNAQAPFVFTAATMTSPLQSLGVNLYYQRGADTGPTQSNTTFVLLNSGISALSNPDVNDDDVSDKEVCTDIANRRP